MRLVSLALVALIAATSVGACAGSPVEAESIGGTAEGGGDTTAASTASNSGSASTTSPSGSAGDPTGASASATTDDPTDDPSGDPSGDPTGDPTSGSSASSGDTSSSTQAGETSSDGGDSSDGSDASDASDSGDVGGCLGDPLPEVAPLECSVNAASAAELEIENTCAFSIEVFWVDQNCDEESYQVISSENSWSVGSFVTHPWRIRNMETGDLILEIPPLRGDTNIIVQ